MDIFDQLDSKPETKKPDLKVGEVHTVRGKQMRITKVHSDGTFDAEPVK